MKKELSAIIKNNNELSTKLNGITNIKYKFELLDKNFAIKYNLNDNAYNRYSAYANIIDDNFKNIVKKVLSNIKQIANINFIEDNDNADIFIGMSEIMPSHIKNLYNAGHVIDIDQTKKAVFFSKNSVKNASELYCTGLITHEIGHVLGLKHPFDFISNDKNERKSLLGEYDSTLYTVMSYDDPLLHNATKFPNGFMYLDIMALQYLYGGRCSSNEYSETYEIVDNNFRGTKSICSNGKVRTINSESISEPVKIDINNKFPNHSMIGNLFFITISDNENIYNIYTGSGDDTINGNEHNNIISAGAGNNIIHGGSGNDIFIFKNEFKGNHIIKDFEKNIDHIHISKTLAEYTAKLMSYIEYKDKSAQININNDYHIILEGITNLTMDDFVLI